MKFYCKVITGISEMRKSGKSKELWQIEAIGSFVADGLVFLR